MNRGSIAPVASMFTGHKVLFAAALGGGAAADGTIPTNGQLADDIAGTYPKAANFATSLTYAAPTGVYTLIYSQQVKHCLFASGIVVDSGSSPTAALVCVVTKINPTTRTITCKIYTPAGTLTDLGTSDLLVLRLDVGDTSTIG